MMIYLWHLRGLERFLECLSVRTYSLDDRWENSATMRVNGTPLAE
jgi:hypothetical protein